MSALERGIEAITEWGTAFDKTKIQDEATAELAKLRASLKSFEDLTPGGSEFCDNPRLVHKWLEDRFLTMAHIALERNQLRAELDEARKVIKVLSVRILATSTPNTG